MKTLYTDGIKKLKENEKVSLLGWIKAVRKMKEIAFIDIADSTGMTSCVLKKIEMGQAAFQYAVKIPPESAVKVLGVIRKNAKGINEVAVDSIELIGAATLELEPHPRKDFDIFDKKYADLTLKNRHLYLRSPKMMAVLKFKHNFLMSMHRWFGDHGFVFIDAPVLTQLLLYDDKSAFKLKYSKKEDIFLSQCNTFQLESAVHAFEKVYNITPSFRAELSRTNRHLREYWHLKAEMSWVNLDEIIQTAEDMFYNVIKNTAEKSEKELETLGVSVNLDEIRPPYKKITYNKALEIINSSGGKMEWGNSFSTENECILTRETGERLLFVRGLPCTAEGFPFSRDPDNPKITKTCDLISPHGFGELLGTAEKIHDTKELIERMKEKGKATPNQIKRYQWYVDLRSYGCMPHGGIGMGIERVIRWVLKLPHVRYAISFPRLVDRHPNP